jgi:hypothetical protein
VRLLHDLHDDGRRLDDHQSLQCACVNGSSASVRTPTPLGPFGK